MAIGRKLRPSANPRFMVDTPFSPAEIPEGSEPSDPGVTAASSAEAPVGTAAVEPAAAPLETSPTAAVEPLPEPPAAELQPAVAASVTAAAAPEPDAVAPEPAAAPSPAVAGVLEVPALEPAAAGADGGEWDLLISKLQDWLSALDLAGQWDRIRGPLKGIAILIGVLIALRAYAAVVGTIGSLPLISGLLELVGAIAFSRFAWDNLLRSKERQKLLADWQQRWSDFSGRN